MESNLEIAALYYAQFSKRVSEHKKHVAITIKTRIAFKGKIFSYEKSSADSFIRGIRSESPLERPRDKSVAWKPWLKRPIFLKIQSSSKPFILSSIHIGEFLFREREWS